MDAGPEGVTILSCVHIREFTIFQRVVTYFGAHGWPWLNSLAHKTKTWEMNLYEGCEFDAETREMREVRE